MSNVTSIILTMSFIEGPDNIRGLNGFLEEQGQLPLADLTPQMIRGKHPQTWTYGGGYNYFPEQAFLAELACRGWKRPESVVLVMQPEEGPAVVWRPDCGA